MAIPKLLDKLFTDATQSLIKRTLIQAFAGASSSASGEGGTYTPIW